MLETTVQLGPPPVAVYLSDPNSALPETLNATAQQSADVARQNEERQRLTQLVEQLSDIAGQLKEQRHGLLQEMQQVAVELAMAVAAQAIYTKVQSGDFPIEAMVQAAIERLNVVGPIVIRLHPDDLALLNRRLEDGRRRLVNADIRFEPDSSMRRGDCRADAGELGVWCKMQNQFEQMRQCVLECLGNAEIERRKTAGSDSGLRRFPDRRQTA